MTDNSIPLALPATDVPQGLARTLRHEVGDFLQKVYAGVAILQARLPPEAISEREILSRIKGGAEECKRLMDAVQDFLSPISLAPESVDLVEMSHQLIDNARARFPNLSLGAEADKVVRTMADPRRLRQIGEALLANACEAARGQVVIGTDVDSDARRVQWTFTDDGPGMAPTVRERLFTPFLTTRSGHAGLGLALSLKFAALHGGELMVENLRDRGVRVTVCLPLRAAYS